MICIYTHITHLWDAICSLFEGLRTKHLSLCPIFGKVGDGIMVYICDIHCESLLKTSGMQPVPKIRYAVDLFVTVNDNICIK